MLCDTPKDRFILEDQGYIYNIQNHVKWGKLSWIVNAYSHIYPIYIYSV